MRKKLTPYQKIKIASERGTGCRLSNDECWQLYRMDEAIKARADMDDEDRLSHQDEVGSAGKYRQRTFERDDGGIKRVRKSQDGEDRQ